VISLVAKVKTTASVRLAVVSLCLVQFVDVLGVTVVVTALPPCWPACGRRPARPA